MDFLITRTGLSINHPEKIKVGSVSHTICQDKIQMNKNFKSKINKNEKKTQDFFLTLKQRSLH